MLGQSTTVVQTASGRPAISYHDITSGTVKFAIAANPDGSGGWTTTTIGSANTGTPSSMAILGGVPCIAYRQSPGDDLAFARAPSADGSGTWTITLVDTVGIVGAHCSLTEVAGRPAISYREQSKEELKYAIAPNAGWHRRLDAGHRGQRRQHRHLQFARRHQWKPGHQLL
jgi:hypothetical protein